jgi:hypothetical protein
MLIPLTSDSDAPDDVLREAAEIRDLFGLHEWEITVKALDCIDDNPTIGGQCTHLEKYRIATIEISRDMLDSPQRREVLMHEFLHIALSHYDSAARNATDLIDGKRHRILAEHMLDEGRERTITLLAKALARAITPTEAPANGEPDPTE